MCLHSLSYSSGNHHCTHKESYDVQYLRFLPELLDRSKNKKQIKIKIKVDMATLALGNPTEIAMLDGRVYRNCVKLTIH